MDGEFSDSQSQLIEFLRNNVMLVLLGAGGLIFLVVGLIQFLAPQQKVEVLSAVDNLSEKSESKPIEKITIDVSGAVIAPGVYEFPQGARIKDAITKAGGLSDDADREQIAKSINLAQPLQDGIKVYIPKVGDSVASSQISSNISSQININTASANDLDTLPGVGPKTAEKIISGRPFTKIEELITKKIVGQATFEKIKDKISVY